MACAESRIQVPVVNRYTAKTIEQAGFKVLDESEDGSNEDMYAGKGLTLLGSKDALVYDYNFSSRDGSERASNTKAAEVLVNLLAQLINIPGFAETVGKERLFMFLNEVVKLSGAGVDLRFDLRDGEPTGMPTGDEAADNKQEITGAIQQILAAIEEDRTKIAQLEQLAAQLTGAMPSGISPAGPAQPGGLPPGPGVNAATLTGSPSDHSLAHPPGVR